MHVRFPRLMALARRMVPGAFEDPHRTLGMCLYCDREVTYAAGDTDADGRPRHDACEKTATRRQMSAISADRLFMHALALLRDLPGMKPHLRTAVHALPDGYGPKEMVRVLADMTPHVESSSISLKMKRDVVVALRDTKRDLCGFAATN